jgi:hypothetical protein
VEAKEDALLLQKDICLAGRIEELAELAIGINGDGQWFVGHGISLMAF